MKISSNIFEKMYMFKTNFDTDGIISKRSVLDIVLNGR